MKSKRKFVLAGLFLLAITGLLALAGCKNDTVPEPTRYTVKFDKGNNNDEVKLPDPITVDSGTKLTDEQLKPLDDTANYIFKYWYDKDDETKNEVAAGYTVTKDVTLVATWRDRDETDRVSFSIDENGKVTLSSATPNAVIYYTIDGSKPKESWSRYDSPIVIPSETTIKAYAQGNELKPSEVISKTYYVVTFNENAEDATGEMTSQTFTEGVAQKLAANGFSSTNSDLRFAGWAESATGEVEYTNEQEITVAKDTTLYAVWKDIPYLTFFTTEGQQILTVKTNENYTLHDSLEYSVGDGGWKRLEANEPITFGGTAGNLRMRGKSAGGMATDASNYAQITFDNPSVAVACSGDIRTLVDHENYRTAETKDARFCGMFAECSSLTSAPALPATTLADYCYSAMFSGCSNLRSVTMLATDIKAEDCLTEWLDDVAASGTFTKAAGMTTLPQNSPSGIPTGWTVKNY